MDFGRPHRCEDGVACQSNIALMTLPQLTVSNGGGGRSSVKTNNINEDVKNDRGDTIFTSGGGNGNEDDALDAMLLNAANDAAMTLFGTSHLQKNPRDKRKLRIYTDGKNYPERTVERTERIKAGSLVVVFESFDNLNFVYAKPGEIFHNRNGQFFHDDFIGQPFGCKIRSRNNGGLGYVFLLRPTAELWSRSLPHRTQIVHELDSSLIVFHLRLRPGMVVCESGTGSGAMSHSLLRTIAPRGHLHTYEFNRMRVERAREEFKRHAMDHMVTVHHRDVCGKSKRKQEQTPSTVSTEEEEIELDNEGDEEAEQAGGYAGGGSATETSGGDGEVDPGTGGFGLGGQAADALFLDLPEPWLAVPHAAYVIKPNGRIGSYSPCVEQTQRVCAELRRCGFHSIRTVEARLREYHVDDVELESPPKTRLPRVVSAGPPGFWGGGGAGGGGGGAISGALAVTSSSGGGGDLVGGATEGLGGDGGKKSSESDGTSISYTITHKQATTLANLSEDTGAEADNERSEAETEVPEEERGALLVASSSSGGGGTGTVPPATKRKKLCARPFAMMRGHTAFLTFATAGLKNVPNPAAEVGEEAKSDAVNAGHHDGGIKEQ